MKTIKLIIAALLLFLLFFNGCIIAITGDVTSPAAADPSMFKLVSLALLAVYEESFGQCPPLLITASFRG